MVHFVDYYEILEIGADTGNDEIREALRHWRRPWRKRQASQDLDSRQRAE